jgi:hypothetical protein
MCAVTPLSRSYADSSGESSCAAQIVEPTKAMRPVRRTDEETWDETAVDLQIGRGVVMRTVDP